MRQLEEIKSEIDEKLRIGHPGDLQIQLSDKCLMHCADANTEYDDEGNEHVKSMNFTFSYYGETIHCTLEQDDDFECFEMIYGEGHLLSSFGDFLNDDDTWPVLSYIWDAIANWEL